MSKKLKHVEETFSTRSLRAKQSLRLSYEELANKSGVDINTLKRILGGKQPARLHEAIEIADALQTTVSYLVDYKDTRYMLSKTRSFYDWLLKEKETKKEEISRINEKEKELDRHISYFTEILEKVDTFKEH